MWFTDIITLGAVGTHKMRRGLAGHAIDIRHKLYRPNKRLILPTVVAKKRVGRRALRLNRVIARVHFVPP